MRVLLKRFLAGLNEVLFPDICVVCGLKLTPAEHCVCMQCLHTKFERAEWGHKQASVILPQGVSVQHSLWRFDKGGELQNLLHHLKYNRLIGVGIDAGRILGQSMLENPLITKNRGAAQMLLIPVPLHPHRRKTRGYNQAYYVAKGVQETTSWEIVGLHAVKRVKNTKTQTGFSLEKRRENIDSAFEVAEPEALKGKICIIVDDVFTTGATTFELAVQLKNHCEDIIIATIAQA